MRFKDLKITLASVRDTPENIITQPDIDPGAPALRGLMGGSPVSGTELAHRKQT
jgi:hypothetical protein